MTLSLALQVLPSGFTIPPLVYLLPLVISAAGVAALLFALGPPVNNWTVVAFAPWMALGAVFHVLATPQNAFPEILAPLFGAPAVYVTTFVLAGLAWIVSLFLAEIRPQGAVDRQLGVMGLGFVIAFVGFSMFKGVQDGFFTPEKAFLPLIGLVSAGVLAGLAWLGLSLYFTDAAATTGWPGAFLVFSHTLDAISTAMGYDVLTGVGERTPISRYILEFSASLPTAQYVGAGWLFVFVKMLLALIIVIALEDLFREEPVQGRVLLGFVAAVGFGPGTHNLLLFAVSNTEPAATEIASALATALPA